MNRRQAQRHAYTEIAETLKSAVAAGSEFELPEDCKERDWQKVANEILIVANKYERWAERLRDK